MPDALFQIRPARDDDRLQLALQFAAVGLHKLSLGVFAHNTAAIELYRKFGFVEEGRRIKQYRRANGDLWDAVEMGLLL